MRIADPDLAESRTAGILNAAIACFARTGFHAASMRDIAKEAGISPALMYRYFASKEAIVAAAVAVDLEEFKSRLAAESVSRASLLDLLENETALRSDPNTYALTCEIMAEAARNPAIAALIRQNVTSSQSALAKTLGPAFGNREKTLAVASYILALVDMLATRQFLGLDVQIRRALETALENPAPFGEGHA